MGGAGDGEQAAPDPGLVLDGQVQTAFPVVFTSLRVDPRTQDYCERRIKEGKTRREIVRCLQRYTASVVFHLVKQLQPGPRS
ncbi:hypothetical protein ACFYS7_02520 [Streptomyces avermitilis]|uniref:hypothetical protein n=1 Tax=Streptomyces avermitilis TaxID=33903 RepID=UPI0036868DD1